MFELRIPLGSIEVYRYLVGLLTELEDAGHAEAAQEVRNVAKCAVGSSSEFFEEVEILLKSLRMRFSDSLSADQLRAMSNMIEQIDEAFRRIGGA